MKLVFIGGCGRSGTTLVQKLLLLHSKITGNGEFDFLPPLLQLYKQMNSPYHVKRQSFFYDKHQLEEHWIKFIQNLLIGNIDAGKYEYLSEKTPGNIDCAEQILELIPESKFIYVYRDGRDVITSFKQVKKRANKKGEKVPYSAEDWASMWNKASWNYRQLENNPGFNNRHIAVRYEELINSPKKVLGEIMAFLGLQVEPLQMVPEAANAASIDMKLDGIWYTDKMFDQKINSQDISNWKNGLTPLQKIKYQVIMAGRLKDYDYPVSGIYLKLQTFIKKVYKIKNGR